MPEGLRRYWARMKRAGHRASPTVKGRKMARRRSGRRRARGRRTGGESQRGILPMTLGAGAVMVPFVEPDSNGYSVVTDIETAAGGDLKALAEVPYHILDGLKNGIWDILGLAGGAVAENWAAKKTGLRRATRVSKKWSML